LAPAKNLFEGCNLLLFYLSLQLQNARAVQIPYDSFYTAEKEGPTTG